MLGGRSWQWHHVVGISPGRHVVVTDFSARRVAGPLAGLLAAGLAAVYPMLVAADGVAALASRCSRCW